MGRNTTASTPGSLLGSAKRGRHRESGGLHKKSVLLQEHHPRQSELPFIHTHIWLKIHICVCICIFTKDFANYSSSNEKEC